MAVVPPEAYEVFLGNIPEWYTEADVQRTFADHCLPVPYKIVLRPGHGDKQFGFAYFALPSEVDFILHQNGLVKSLIEWSDGNYALIRRAKAKASSQFIATQLGAPVMPKVVLTGVIRVSRSMNIAVKPPLKLRLSSQTPPAPSPTSSSSSHSAPSQSASRLPIPPPPAYPMPPALPFPPRPLMSVQPSAVSPSLLVGLSSPAVMLPSPPIALPQPAGVPSVLGSYTQAVAHGFPPRPPPPRPPPPPDVGKPKDPRIRLAPWNLGKKTKHEAPEKKRRSSPEAKRMPPPVAKHIASSRSSSKDLNQYFYSGTPPIHALSINKKIIASMNLDTLKHFERPQLDACVLHSLSHNLETT